MTRFERVACRTASWLASPTALIAIPAVCTAWLLAGLSVDLLTNMLSIFAISTTQLVIVAQEADTRATKAMITELVHAVPEADDSVAEEGAAA